MKKFKVTFYADERSKEQYSEIVEAINDDEAERIVSDKYNGNIFINEIFEYFDTPLNDKQIYVDMPDGFTYIIPVMVVAQHKAMTMTRHADDFLFSDAMREVLSEFENDELAIKNWATGEMYWKDVKDHAIILKKNMKVDYQLHWANGKLEIK